LDAHRDWLCVDPLHSFILFSCSICTLLITKLLKVNMEIKFCIWKCGQCFILTELSDAIEMPVQPVFKPDSVKIPEVDALPKVNAPPSLSEIYFGTSFVYSHHSFYTCSGTSVLGHCL
jgi:hypothetical protein